MSDQFILYGAGTIGRLIARQLIAKGTPPAAFADNDPSKWNTEVEGTAVWAPEICRVTLPNAKWVATVHRTPYRPEIIADMKQLGVKSVSLYEFLPARCDLPPERAEQIIDILLEDEESIVEWNDQLEFRRNPSTHRQRPPRDITNVYFENFFTHRDDEHFVDCGAADGDTIKEFIARWEKWDLITAFEPDSRNYAKLWEQYGKHDRINVFQAAVGDHQGKVSFVSTGDQTAHIGEGEEEVDLVPLDWSYLRNPPTFIKMDIEGSELEGLWGAGEILKKHKPVLAICAYHQGSHLWEIPLLIHAIQPEYKLYLRRYLEATWELIWYAVPPERAK